MLEAMQQWCSYKLADLTDYAARARVCNVPEDEVRKDVLAIVLDEDITTAQEKAKSIMEHGPLPEFFFSRNGTGALSRKVYIEQIGDRPVTNLWPFAETGHTDEASRLLKTMFEGTAVFDTPKPPRLIELILHVIRLHDRCTQQVPAALSGKGEGLFRHVGESATGRHGF